MGDTRKVTLEEARQIVASNPNASVIWRPEENLPENEQYAVVLHE